MLCVGETSSVVLWLRQQDCSRRSPAICLISSCEWHTSAEGSCLMTRVVLDSNNSVRRTTSSNVNDGDNDSGCICCLFHHWSFNLFVVTFRDLGTGDLWNDGATLQLWNRARRLVSSCLSVKLPLRWPGPGLAASSRVPQDVGVSSALLPPPAGRVVVGCEDLVVTWSLRPGPSHRFVRLQVVLLVQGVQDGQVFLHGWQVNSEVPVHAVSEAALLLVALLGHQGGGKALVGWSGLQCQLVWEGCEKCSVFLPRERMSLPERTF